MAQEEKQGGSGYQIENSKAFSKSKIWQLNQEFYQSKGISAWTTEDVPFHVTSNARIGKIYGELIFAMLKDIARSGHLAETVYILELGAGHGKLSFHVLQALEILVAGEKDPLPPYTIIISDIVEENLLFFEKQKQLQQYIAKNQVDIAYYNAIDTDDIFLRLANKTISKGELKHPIITLANYFFDSIPNDLFYYESGQMASCEVALYSSKEPKSSKLADLKEDLSQAYSLIKYHSNYYTDELKTKLVEAYAQEIRRSYIPFPIAGIDCLDRIASLSQGGMILLSMDKGSYKIRDLDGISTPDAVHHGSLSFMVNYHALGTYCEERGGRACYPSSTDFDLEFVCFYHTTDHELYHTSATVFNRLIDNFGPDDINSYKKFFYKNIDRVTARDMITFIRMFAYDAMIFQEMIPIIKQLLSKISFQERERLGDLFDKVWSTYYNITDYDLAFEIGGLHYALAKFERALSFFSHSENIHGKRADVYYNRLLCYYELRKDQLFRDTFIEAKERFPKFENWLAIEKLDLDAV